ncbi:putative RNA recognition motif domain, nucleotide-binding alpha-beta plait domain superfamily [Helianthus anomalus]
MATRRLVDRDGQRSGTDITKFFVVSLPDKCGSEDIVETLGPFGSIEGVYVAWKRDKQGFRFGFVSFKGVKDAVELEKTMRNFWMSSYKLFINISKFSRENDEGRDDRDPLGKTRVQSDQMLITTVVRNRKTTGITPLFQEVKLTQAIIGKTEDLWTLRKMKVLIKEGKFGDAVIKYLDGLSILVSLSQRLRPTVSGLPL